MSKKLNPSSGMLRLFVTVLMLLTFLVGLAPAVGAEPAAPDSGTVTSVTINSPTTANPAYINPTVAPFTVDFSADGTGNGWVWARVGYPGLGWGDDPVTGPGTLVTFPHTEQRDIAANCTEGTYDVGVWAQGQSQTTWLYTNQPNAAVVDCTDPVVPANPLIAPNGGENLMLGSVFNVTWDPTKITDANLGSNPVSLYLDCTIDGVPLPQTMIATGLPNTGLFAWTVGGAVGTCTMTLEATDLAGNDAEGMSANTFTISGLDSSAPTVTLLTPPGATTPNWNWLKGGPYNFTANASDPQSGVKAVEFEISQDAGTTWPFVNAATSGPSPYGFSWNTATLPENTELWVRAKATNGLDAFAYSAINKRIKVDNTAPNAGAITAPAAGANIKGTVDVAANPTDGGSGVAQVLFEYSLNGTTWQPLGTDTSATGGWKLAWDTTAQIPAGQQGNAWLRATATDGVGFTATTAVVQVFVDNKVPAMTQPFLTAPNGGEVWQIGVDHNITWDATKVADRMPQAATPEALGGTPVTLFYSANGGATWTQIATGLALAPGVYAWLGADNAGLLQGANYMVKIEVQDLAGNKVSDISAAAFTFWNNDGTAPTVSQVTAVAPLTAGFAKGTVNVTGQGLDLESGIQAIRFQVSLNGGTTWTDIGTAPTLTYAYATHLWSGTVAWNTGAFSGNALLRAIAMNGNGNEINPALAPVYPVMVDNSAPALSWDAGYASLCLVNGVFGIGVQAVEVPQTNMASVKFEYSLNGGTTWLEINGAGNGTVLGDGPAFAINWNTAALPDGPAILRATAKNEAGLSSTITNRYVFVKNSAAVSPQVTCLQTGWNMYSSPLVIRDDNMAPIATVLAGPVAHGTLNQVRTFIWEGSPLALNSKAWFPAIGGDIDYIKDGQSYWFNLTAPDVLAVEGTERSVNPLYPPRSYPVYTGWNMIGFTSVVARNVHNATPPPQGYLDPQVYPAVSAMYGYNRITKLYEVPVGGVLWPNEGYWLAVNANGTIYP